MIRIFSLFHPERPVNAFRLSQVKRIFAENFSGEGTARTFARLLKRQREQGSRVVLMVAEGARGDVQGFALAYRYAKVPFTYLDFIVTIPRVRRRGTGSALYEALREDSRLHDERGVLLEVRTDDAAKVGQDELDENRERLRFYEKYGARPIEGTLFDQDFDPRFPGVTKLLFDPVDRNRPLRRRDLRAALKAILVYKYALDAEDRYVHAMLESVRDEPVRVAAPRFAEDPEHQSLFVRPKLRPIKLIHSPNHRLHHVKERGYIERPARIDVILKELQGIAMIEAVAVQRFDDRPIRAVHDHDFVTYLRSVCQSLNPGEAVYPYVFPLRNPHRRPQDRPTRAGYYCIDTFTPLFREAYTAARGAVNCSLTGAHLILQGESIVYALVRPPGHHAERRVYGGFCYFNNAAIAAHEIAKAWGRVAVLDIDYHHGNGTQDIFYDRDDVLVVSLHGHPRFAYPYFSGFEDERGEKDGRGYNLNIPLPWHCDDRYYFAALQKALRRVRRHKPEVVVVSVGFDIAKGDPTGGLCITAHGFREIGRQIGALDAPLLLIQEGGYKVRHLGTYARSFLAGVASTRP